MASQVPTFDDWMEKMYPDIPRKVTLVGKMGHKFPFPNKNYNEKKVEYERNLAVFEPAISRNARLYDISTMKINSLSEDMNNVDEMGKYYLNNAFKKLDKAKFENEMLKNEITQWEAIFQCRETAHSTVKYLEL